MSKPACQSMRMHELGERVHLTQSALSRLIARLETDGLLERTMCVEDRRSVFAKLTPAGATRYQEAKPTQRVESLLEKAEAEGRDLGPVHGLRAMLALERGRLRQALAEAGRAVVLSPQEVSGWYVRGRVRLERAAAGDLPDLQKATELSGRKDADVLQALLDQERSSLFIQTVGNAQIIGGNCPGQKSADRLAEMIAGFWGKIIERRRGKEGVSYFAARAASIA